MNHSKNQCNALARTALWALPLLSLGACGAPAAEEAAELAPNGPEAEGPTEHPGDAVNAVIHYTEDAFELSMDEAGAGLDAEGADGSIPKATRIIPRNFGWVYRGSNAQRRCRHTADVGGKNYNDSWCGIPKYGCPTHVEINYNGLGNSWERQAFYDGLLAAMNHAFGGSMCFIIHEQPISNEDIHARLVNNVLDGAGLMTPHVDCPLFGCKNGNIYAYGYTTVEVDIGRLRTFYNKPEISDDAAAIRTTAAHEFLHAVGLGHNNVEPDGGSRSLMYSALTVDNHDVPGPTSHEIDMLRTYEYRN